MHLRHRRNLSRLGDTAAGFTLLEMFVVLGLVAILLLLGVPEVRKTILRAKLDGALRDVTMQFRLARTEAIKRGLDTVVQVVPGEEKVNSFIDFPQLNAAGNRIDNPWYYEPVGVFGQRDEAIGEPFSLPFGVFLDAPGAFNVVEDLTDRGAPPAASAGAEQRAAVFTSTGGVRATGSVHLADNRGNYFQVLVSPATTGKVQVRKWDCGASEWVERRGEWPWYFGSAPAC